jgi:hypothetical protein
LFFLRRGKDRGNGRSRKAQDKTDDWDLRSENSMFHCLIWERISTSLKVYPLLVPWHMDYGYFSR